MFNYNTDDERTMHEHQMFDEKNTHISKEKQCSLKIEKFIMNLEYCFFYKSCITHHHFRYKRALVDQTLDDLVSRQLLYSGDESNLFFETKRLSAVKTYLKFLPNTNDEQRFRNDLLQLYNIKYEDYVNKFKQSLLLP